MQIEADTIKAIVDFELRRNVKDSAWTFRRAGIGSLADDFFLFNEYLSSYSSDRLKRWCVSFGKWLLPKEDIDRIDAIKDENLKAEELVGKVRPLLQPLWSFFVALCHALQEGENELTATDAYWLGLVDEVVGEDLLSLRTFEEYKDDESPKGPDNQSNEGTK